MTNEDLSFIKEGDEWFVVMAAWEWLGGGESWFPISEMYFKIEKADAYARERESKGDIVRVARLKFVKWE